jgi:hypothetical protein
MSTLRSIIKAIGTLTLITMLSASLALAASPKAIGHVPRIAAPNSMAFGKTLTEWTSTYWRWALGGGDPSQSMVGRVQLMPLPAGVPVGGTGTPEDPTVYKGQLEITLPPGTPFVLPLFAWIWERYDGYPAVPDDTPIDDEVALASGQPTLTIDGKTIITDANKAAFYVPATAFDPIVVYPEPSWYGSVAAVSFQSVAFVSPPLPPGTHVIHLYEPMSLAAWNYYVIYDNTWVVTVAPK